MEKKSRSTLRRLGATRQDVDEVIDRLEDRWFDSGPNSLSPIEQEVLVLSSFVGEVANGGLLQFLLSDYGILLPRLSDAFKLVNISELEAMAQEILGNYPGTALENEDKFFEWTCHLNETNDPGFFPMLERPFWELFPDQVDREWFTRAIGDRLFPR